jgi:hypothetical protein
MAARFSEPLRRTLARTVSIAVVVGAAFALLRHDLSVFLPLTVLALWITLGGHYVELAFINGVRGRIPPGRWTQAAVRLLVWSGGGVLLSFGMAATARAILVKAPPSRPWWFGALLFVGVELTVHAVLAIRGAPNFYDGRG